jgi:NADPH-dependent 7-cyano-7-deazaguanine reductase QueF
MVKLVSEKSANGRVRLEFEAFASICRFTGHPDVANLGLDYAPGRDHRLIDSKKLEEYLGSFRIKRIAMEMIPVEILKFCIESCLKEPPPTRYAVPDDITLRYEFTSGGGKDWGMTVNVRFDRKIV